MQESPNNFSYPQPEKGYVESEIAPTPPQPRPWGPWATIGLGAVVFIIYSIVQGVIYLFVALATIGSWENFDLMQFIESLNTNGLGISISTIIAAPIGILLIIVFAKLRRGMSLSEYLGLRPLSWRSIPVLLVIPVVLAVLLGLIGNYVVEPGEPDIMLDAYRNSIWPPLFWLAIVIFAPAFEEFLFRGFALAGLQRSRLGSTGAIILTAVIWALLHIQYEWFGMTVILVIGIVLGIARVKTKSIWAPVLMHSVWNLLQMILMVLVINGVIQQ